MTQDITGASPGPAKPPWQKVLWRKQPYEDDYVPKSFLAELDDIPVRPPPSVTGLVFGALPISQHLAVIALFLAVFHRLLAGVLGPGAVGWTVAGVSLLGYRLKNLGWGVPSPHYEASQKEASSLLPSPSSLRPLLLPPLLLSLLSPLLGTLTSATTSDSIWPLAGGLLFIHLLLADFTTSKSRYRKPPWTRSPQLKGKANVARETDERNEKSLTSSLSLTSALSASVVLASRLPTTAHVFSLVLLAVALFAGWPLIAKQVRQTGRGFSLSLTGSMILLASSLFPSARQDRSHHPLLPHGSIIIFFGVICLVNVIGPLILRWGWRWKTTRVGGWDVAVVRVKPDDQRQQS